ncbi:hypothetical protein [Treponema saccharophilum]|jgi:hypothetical protein|uniref:hypothetical protein n=1 Tax=Treponema saccharophilum TaxID=165 RepID=UPI00386A28E9
MKIRQRPRKPDPVARKKVNYKVRYIGEMTLSLTPGGIYQCVAEITEPALKGYLGVIDESGDSYVYSPKLFVKVE